MDGFVPDDTQSLDDAVLASYSAAPVEMEAAMSIMFSDRMESIEKAELAEPVSNRTTLFSGKPQGSGEIILFDSSRDQAVHPAPETGTINRLVISFADGMPAAESLGAELCLLVYVGDLATPRAKVKLADLVRQGCARPLNLSRKRGEALQLALIDPAGLWSGGAPQIEVALEWA